jgi:plastocyanin
MWTRLTIALVALMTSLCALALVPVTPASADTGHPRMAAGRTGANAQATPAPDRLRTWHVLVGGQSEDHAVQAEGYYPHVITIDVGDTVVWTLNTVQILGVSFAGTCEKASCIPPGCLTITIDYSPCGPSSYDGVTALDQSGRMLAPANTNWNNSIPHGTTTYSLTFTRPGVNVYFDLSVSGMRGVVIVHPAGTPYPFTQAQYSAQAQQQLRADLVAGARARGDAQPVTASAGPGGSRTYRVALGASPPETARLELDPAAGSAARGRALLDGSGIGTSPDPSIAVTVRLSGLAPGSVHAVQILPGVCGAPAPMTGIFFSKIFVPPAHTLNALTAGPDGTATSTTDITEPPNANGPAQLAIPSSGWFINVAAGPAADNGATSAACGNVAYHSAAVMRYLPRNLHIHVGDTVVWANDTSNQIHAVTFLAAQPVPQIPDWYNASPTGNGISYDGSSYFNSGPLYRPDAASATPGAGSRPHSLTLTFTKTGTFSYVDVPAFFMGMHGSVIVAP